MSKDAIFWVALDVRDGRWWVMTQRSMGSAFACYDNFATCEEAWAWIRAQAPEVQP